MSCLLLSHGISCPSDHRFDEQLLQLLKIDRFRKVMIEAGFVTLSNVFFLAPASLGDQKNVLAPGFLSHSSRDFKTTHLRHTDIQ